MSRDDEEKDPRLFDRRVIARNLRKGFITDKDVARHLKALPDVAGNLAPPPGDDDARD